MNIAKVLRLSGHSTASRIAKGIVGSVFIKVTGIALTLVSAVVLARVLGASNYGVYAFVYAVVTLVAIPVQSGLPTLIVRVVAASEVKREWGLIRGLLQRSGQFVFFLSILVAVTTGVLAWEYREAIGTARAETFIAACLLLPLLGLGAIRAATLRGLRKVIAGQLPEQVLRPTFFVVLVLAAYWMTDGTLGATTAMELHAFAALLAFVIGAWVLYNVLPKELKGSATEFETKAWLISLFPLSVLSGVQVVNGQASTIILGILGTDEEVGIFRVAERGATLVLFSFQAVNMVIAPYISRMYKQGDVEKLRRLVTASARISFFAALVVAIGFIIFGETILRELFGSEFVGGHVALAILCLGHLVNSAMGSVAVLLNMSGHEKDTVYGISVAAFVNIALNILLIPHFGMNGAAAATALATVLWSVLLARQVHRRLDLNPTVIAPLVIRNSQAN